MKTSLSPKDVARAIGVSESSLKRWADHGKLQVTKTPGGHRRIQVYDALRFAREAHIPIQRPDILGMPELALIDPELKREEALEDTLFDLLHAGKSAEFRGVIMDRFLSGQRIAQICDGPVRAALYRLGKLWENNDQGILLEHRATDIIIQSLRELRPLIDPTLQLPTVRGGDIHNSDGNGNGNGHAPRRLAKQPPVAVGSTPPSDPYRVTTLMVCLTLMEAGYHAINLGADLPYHVLAQASEEHQASLVWLSATSHQRIPAAEDLIDLAQMLGPKTILALGGQAMPKLPANRPDNILLCNTLRELSAFVTGLQKA